MSGGPDSLALLLLAQAAFPDGVEVATVDHGLRPDSAEEAASVGRICAALAIPHAVLTVDVARTGNLQAAARAARYAALADWRKQRNLHVIATAHHADDQAETLLMRLNRGAGVRGLAGMRAAAPLPGTPEVPLIRPLLGWRRQELVGIVAGSGIAAVNDPSNENLRFERVRVRKGLAQADWLDPAALAASAARLADADEALDWTVRREWEASVEADDRGGLLYRPDAAPRAVRLRVLERVVATIGSAEPRGGEFVRWLESLENGRIATLGGVKGAPGGDVWVFSRVPPHRHP